MPSHITPEQMASTPLTYFTGPRAQCCEALFGLDILLTIAVSMAVWATMWFVSHYICYALVPIYRKMTPGKRADWNSRVVSCFHAFYVTQGGLRAWFGAQEYYGDAVFCNPAIGNYYLAVMGGYLIYDLAVILYYWDEIGEISMLVHHLAGSISLIVSTAYGIGTVYTVPFAFTEASTPFVNFKWFMDHLGPAWKESKLYIVNGLLLAFFFLVIRVPLTPYIIYHQMWLYPEDYWALPSFVRTFIWSTFGPVSVLNYMWSYKIIRGLVRLAFSGGFSSKKPGAAGATKSEKKAIKAE